MGSSASDHFSMARGDGSLVRFVKLGNPAIAAGRIRLASFEATRDVAKRFLENGELSLQELFRFGATGTGTSGWQQGAIGWGCYCHNSSRMMSHKLSHVWLQQVSNRTGYSRTSYSRTIKQQQSGDG